jgi:hypothetical protein
MHYLLGTRDDDMRLNSEETVRQALIAHRRYGSWQAVRDAVAARLEQAQSNGRGDDQSARETAGAAQRRG